MLERELQDYLFENPEVLFPAQVVDRVRREVFISGRRIDLLFEVEGAHYIVELKRDTIRREDIGQVFEYYGLMRQSRETATFKMILVAPSIPAYRRIPLEEFGIRCVEVSQVPQSLEDRTLIRQKASATQRRIVAEQTDTATEPLTTPLRFEDFLPPATPKSLRLAQALLREGLVSVQKTFAEYEVIPVKMMHHQNPGILCFPEANPASRFVAAGAWWAFSFGHSEHMPKNDVPNISVNALPWGLDFAINAELLTSQEVMRRRIERLTGTFDQLVAKHGNLQLQAWLKIEHQPRIYHWILLTTSGPGMWTGQTILDLYRQTEIGFPDLRARWLGWIKAQRSQLTPGQGAHMERTNRKLNLALRLVRSFEKDDVLWAQTQDEQQARFQEEYGKLKPLIDFFQ